MSINKFADTAKNLAVGGFAILNDASDSSGYDSTFTASGIATFNSFAYKATYDPLWHRIFIMGDGGHLSGGTTKFACYEMDYDRWTLIPNPPFDPTVISGPTNHLYGLQAHVSKPGSNVFFKLLHNRTNVFTWETDHADLTDIVYQGQVYPPPLTPDVDNGSRGNFEYFPERDEFIFHFSFGGNIYVKPYSGGSWTALTGWTDSALINAVKHDGVGMLYHPVAKCVVWGGGSDLATTETTNTRWWRYDADGSITELDEFLFDQNGLAGWAAFGSDNGPLLVADPGSNKYVMFLVDFNDLSSIFMFELDPFAAPGSQWTQLDSSLAATWPADLYNSVTSNITAICIPEYNVMFFSAYNKTWLYRHSAPLTFDDKKEMHGVLSSFPFTSQTELKYTWQNAGTPAVAPLEDYLATQGSGIGFDYPWPFDINRTSGQGNTSFGQQPITGALSGPEIDAEGLRWTIPTRSYEGFGAYNANFDDILHDDSADSIAINPDSPNGRVIYIQMRVKADAAFWGTDFRRDDLFEIDDNSQSQTGLYGASCLAGSDILAVPPTAGYSQFTSAYLGKEIAIISGSPAANWVPGFYTITQVIDAQHVRLDASPCPTANGNFGFLRIEGTIDHGFGQPHLLPGGVKLAIITGNPPNYGTPSIVATIRQRREGTNTFYNGPHFVQGSTGLGPTDANFNDELFWDEGGWNELTFRIEVGSDTDSTGWRVTWWLNGLKYDPETDWYDGALWQGPEGFWYSGSPPIGFGWLQITPQMTHKDMTQDHEEGHLWVKEVIISTEPIQFGSSDATPPPPVSAASFLPWVIKA